MGEQRTSGDNEPAAGALAAATDLCQHLYKALRAFRLYADGHGARGEFLSRSHAKLGAWLDEFGPLVLEVGAHALSLAGKPVYQDPEDGDSLAHTLFLDGVQRISFLPGIDAEEMEGTLRLWSQAVAQTLPEGRTFTTEIWERDFPSVRLASLESLFEDEGSATGPEARDTVASVMAELVSEVVPLADGQPLLGSELAALWDVEAVARVDREALRRLDEAGRAPIAGLTPEEVAALVAEITASRDHPLDRLLLTVWGMLPVATPDERTRLIGLTALAIDRRLQERRYDEVRKACFRIIAARTPSRDADLHALLQPLARPEAVEGMTADLEDQDRGASAEALLRFLPRAAHALLVDALAKGPLRAEGRRRLAAILVTMRPDPALLAARAGQAPAAAIPALLALAEASSPEDAIRVAGAALANPDPAARIEAIGRLKRPALVALRDTLQKLLDDPEPEVRRRLTMLLLSARDPNAIAALRARLEDDATEPAERRTVIRALVMFRGPEAALALRCEFGAKRDLATRVACARALAEIGDEEARPLLRAARYKLMNPAALRQACEEAMTRLDQLRQAPPRDGGHS